jgi:hypothetical protein
MDGMGILENLENAWDDDFEFESKPIPETDNLGRETFWKDLGRPEDKNLLAQTSCSCFECSCSK